MRVSARQLSVSRDSRDAMKGKAEANANPCKAFKRLKAFAFESEAEPNLVLYSLFKRIVFG